MAQPGPLPPSVEEVESLIHDLYDPKAADRVSGIQEILLQLQRSPFGWMLARDLLARPNETIRFFGALTITIKINTQSDELRPEEAIELLHSLLGWYLNSIADGRSPLVAKKLCSALVAFHLRFPGLCPRSVYHLVLCLASREVHPMPEARHAAETSRYVSSLGAHSLQAGLWFATNLADEAGKLDMNMAQSVVTYSSMVDNAADVATLMSEGLNRISLSGIQGDSIKCLQSWITFCQRQASRDDILAKSLQPLIDPVIRTLATNHTYEAAAETLTDILTNHPGFLRESDYASLQSVFLTPWAQQLHRGLVQGDFEFVSAQYGQLLVAFGNARLVELMRQDDETSRILLSQICVLLAAQGHAVGEDTIFTAVLEFWATFVETLADELNSGESEPEHWIHSSTAFASQAVSNVWRRAAFPPAAEFNSWDSNDRIGFNDARKEITDFLQSAYTIFGPRIIATFADLVLETLASQSWPELEAAIFCLGSLADCVLGSNSSDSILRNVFDSPLFNIFLQPQTEFGGKLKQTCASLIEKYAEYFERNANNLPSALTLLFGAVTDPFMGLQASRAIFRLCSSCRTILTGELGGFLTHYRYLSRRPEVDCQANEKLVCAVASIVQAMEDTASRHEAVQALVSLAQADADMAMNLVHGGDAATSGNQFVVTHRCSSLLSHAEFPQHIALKALRSLASIGKGLQNPTDHLVDLELLSTTLAAHGDPSLLSLQANILSMISQLQSSFPENGEIVETICGIFRAGFSETDPGPLVFPPDSICSFFTQQKINVPRIGLFVSTACSFASSIGRRWTGGNRNIIESMVLWVVGLLCAGMDNDIELSQNGIEFMSKVASRDPTLLLGLRPAELLDSFFEFSLHILEGREPLPRAAAAEFWATFFSLKSPELSTQQSIERAISRLGPAVTMTLVRGVGGNASRSELDRLSDPLKKLVTCHVAAPAWLEAALLDPSFPSQKISKQDKMTFLKKVINLRGARTTNQVVRDFWLAARGSNFAYTS